MEIAGEVATTVLKETGAVSRQEDDPAFDKAFPRYLTEIPQ